MSKEVCKDELRYTIAKLESDLEEANAKLKEIAKLYAEAIIKYSEMKFKAIEQAKYIDVLEEANDGLTEKVNSMGNHSKEFEVSLEVERQRVKYRDNTIQRMSEEIRELKEKIWMMENNC